MPEFLHNSRNVTILRNSFLGATILIVALRLFTGVDDAPFHGDEAGWTAAGYYYFHLMFIDHDVSPASWNRRDFHEFGILSLPVGKYLIGLAMHIVLPKGQYVYHYDFSKDVAENARLGNVPPPNVLRVGRLCAAVFSFGTCCSLFWFCWKTWNWIVGAVSALLLSYNSLFTLFAHRAMTDAYIGFFLVIMQVICLAMFQRRGDFRKFLMLSALGGITVGLCASVKLNGLMGLGYFALVVLFCFVIERRKVRRAAGFYLSALALNIFSSALTMIAVNPFFYTASPSALYTRFTYLVSQWNELLAYQQRIFPQQSIGSLSTVLGRITADYFPIVLTCFLVVGLIQALRVIGKDGRKAAPELVSLGFFIVTLVAVGSWIPLDWDRYYLPIILAEIPLAAYGLFEIGRLLIGPVLARITAPEAAKGS